MRAVAASTTAEVVRPFLWVAGLGFTTGFLGFLTAWSYLAPAG